MKYICQKLIASALCWLPAISQAEKHHIEVHAIPQATIESMAKKAEGGYDAECVARVWRIDSTGGYGDLLLYRHGRDQTAINVEGKVYEFIPLIQPALNSSSLKDNPSKQAFLTSISVIYGKSSQSFILRADKSGFCRHEEPSGCVRAVGVFTNASYAWNNVWALASDIPVIIEDTCARSRSGRFIDALPFYKKMLSPMH